MLSYLKRLFTPKPAPRVYERRPWVYPIDIPVSVAQEEEEEPIYYHTSVGLEKDERTYKAGDKQHDSLEFDLNKFWACVSELPHDSGFAEFERVRQSTGWRG